MTLVVTFQIEQKSRGEGVIVGALCHPVKHRLWIQGARVPLLCGSDLIVFLVRPRKAFDKLVVTDSGGKG